MKTTALVIFCVVVVIGMITAEVFVSRDEKKSKSDRDEKNNKKN